MLTISTQIYKRNEYIIFKSGKGYIVQNTNKDFSTGHSHMNNFNACKNVINYCIHRKIPKRTSNYYLETLRRVSNDNSYRDKLEVLIDARECKSRNYYINVNKGIISN